MFQTGLGGHLIEHVLETVNEFTKNRREHIDSIDNEIKQVKEKITNVKQGWISYAMRLDETFPAANVIMVNAEVFKW
jgi:hypothetical protein